MEVCDYIEFGLPGSVLYRGFLLSDSPSSATTAPSAVTAPSKSSSSCPPSSIIQSARDQEDTTILHPISTWDDVPIRPADSALSHGGGGLDGLMAGDIISMVCCTPRNLWVQIEAAYNEACHPLRVRQVDGLPAHYSHNLDWNLGIIPQTCSCRQGDNVGGDPQSGSCDKACDAATCATMCDNACDSASDKHTPLEVIEIGRGEVRVGQVYLVKPLLAFLVISPDLKSSWKIVAVNSLDPMAETSLDSRSVDPPNTIAGRAAAGECAAGGQEVDEALAIVLVLCSRDPYGNAVRLSLSLASLLLFQHPPFPHLDPLRLCFPAPTPHALPPAASPLAASHPSQPPACLLALLAQRGGLRICVLLP
ncbi:unnamed protein product [Closterium sp. NIES-65]|nr:unnamed protein product [Closterium sp. NIES-65]